MSEMPQQNWVFQARLIRIVDGDTAWFLIDNGFRNREEHSIRFMGVNAAEIFTKDAIEKTKGYLQKAWVESWFNQHFACGYGMDWPLIIQTEKDKQTLGRYIGTIWCAECGECLNDYMIEKIAEYG